MASKKKKFVAYYRVSTKKQNEDMKAQKTAIKNYLKHWWPPVKSVTEVESGGKFYRPELEKALNYCNDYKATLVVAKLDRLSRDLEFIGWIQKTDIEFVCCDMPQAGRETIGFMGVMARWEREQISKRTKEALAEKKKEGIKLGYHNPRVKAAVDKRAKKLAIIRAEKARIKRIEREKIKKAKVKNKPIKKAGPSKRELADQKVWPTIRTLRNQGYSYNEIAQALNDSDIKTRWGKKWRQTQVINVTKRNKM